MKAVDDLFSEWLVEWTERGKMEAERAVRSMDEYVDV
jgi:hypothetical protein